MNAHVEPEKFKQPDLKMIRARSDRAWGIKAQWQPLLDEVYEFIIPYRDKKEGSPEGKPRMDRVFDSTAIKAAFKFPGRVQRDVTPPHQDFLKLAAGPLVPPGEERKKLNEQLGRVGEVVQAVMRGGGFDTSSHEMYMELFAGTGCLLVLKGDEYDLVDFISVPLQEVALELDAMGRRVTGVYWKKKYRADQLREIWPDGKFSEAVEQLIENGSVEDVEIIQYTYYRKASRDYGLLVWEGESPKAKDGKSAQEQGMYIRTSRYRTMPWVTPRFFVVPGETYGRGPAQIALPFVKTLNKTQELALRNAAFSLIPAWMSPNGSGLNVDMARIAPGSVVKVNRTGGAMGSALEKLPIGDNFDVNMFNIKDQREQVKETLFDSALPDAAGAVRSPTEILQRIQSLVQDLDGAYGRLVREFILPITRRVIDILEDAGQLDTNLQLHALLVSVSVTSPIAQAQGADKVRIVVEWLQMILQLMGPEGLQIMARMDEIIPEIGRMLGVEERFIKSKAEQDETKKQMQEAAQQQAEAEAQAKAGAQPEEQQGVEDMLGVSLQ